MKNKIIKKIILVVSCVTVLVSAFVIPSFAYSVSEPSTDNPGLGSPEYVFTPNVNMEVDYYANGVKKSSCFFPLFSNLSYSDGISFIQVPDAEDYGQLVGHSNTYETDIFDTDAYMLYLLRQVMHSSIIPNYDASDVDFDYYITDLNNSCLYFNESTPYGMNYSTFIHLDDNYNIGDTITYQRSYSYLTTSGSAQGQIERDVIATVSYNEYNEKGVYIYYYNSSILETNWLVTNVGIHFDNPIVITDSLIVTTSRFLCTETYGGYIYDYLVNSDIDNYAMGYADGVSVGEQAGFDAGYLEGASVGYDNGYDEGYNAGYVDGGNGQGGEIENPYEFILTSVSAFLAWEFIPGISFSLIASVFVGAILMIILLKKLAGG